MPGEPPNASKVVKVQAWLRRAIEESECDEIKVLGGVLEELMDRDMYSFNGRPVDELRAKVNRALGAHSLSYQRGGVILGATLLSPSRSVEDLIRERNPGGLHKEFDRALAHVESDPPAAVTAACAILESLFKVIIADEGLQLPSDQSVLPLFRVVQPHLGLQPVATANEHVRQTLQGLVSCVHGIAGLRSNVGSAHGRGPGATDVEARYARLAVHAAHTVVAFALESRQTE